MNYRLFLPVLFLLPALGRCADANPAPAGTVVAVPFTSTVLRDNSIGLSPDRDLRVYLPPSYATSPDRRYPVVYYCHNFYWSPAQMFADGNMQRLLERGFASGAVGEFILVAADYTSPTTGSLYENSPVSGRWLDYTTAEIVPLIDERFRTLPQGESRALVGDFFGGRGALVLGMSRPDLFGTVYALHPVATGTGELPLSAIELDWPAIHAATTFADLPPGRERIFVAFSQGFLPHPGRLPFHCDFPVEFVDGTPQLVPGRVRQLQRELHVDEWLDSHAETLRHLRGLAFDWGRFDPTRAHVFAARNLSRRLAELGIPHEAEEYAGGVWDRTWTPDGRFASRVLPFLARHLTGAAAPPR